jgi:hypothetical protein
LEEKLELFERIVAWRKERYSAQKRWSTVHHLALFGSIVCSVIAGAVIQFAAWENITTLLTSLAAILTGIAASGGFERKWRSNRLSRSAADRLLLDLESDNCELKEIRGKFKQAIKKHDLEIVGENNDQA